jgi:hypothetical protein
LISEIFEAVVGQVDASDRLVDLQHLEEGLRNFYRRTNTDRRTDRAAALHIAASTSEHAAKNKKTSYTLGFYFFLEAAVLGRASCTHRRNHTGKNGKYYVAE